MIDFSKIFKGKKITVMGLGLLGRGVGDIRFLAEQGADLIVTDVKSSTELAPSLKKLKKFKNIKYVLGKHRLKDFRNRDMILKAAGVPLDSAFIKEARLHKIPVEMSASLFAKLTPATIVGITGTRGKSTTTHLVYEIFKKAHKKVYLGGNVKGIATLPLLKKAKKGDVIVMELDSWQLQGFGGSHISPHISVFTNFLPDHLNYYKGNMADYLSDKANIFKYQTKDDILILGEQCQDLITKKYPGIKSKIICPKVDMSYKIKILGEHNLYNTTLAVAVAKVIGINHRVIKSAVKNFSSVPGRLELIRTHKGVKIYNDTTATTPVATLAAFKALGKNKNIVLIFGGADKGIDMDELLSAIPKYCKAVVVLPGTGTDRIKSKVENLKVKFGFTKSLEDAITESVKVTKFGDIILFSPAFASFGLFKNEYDRGDQFDKQIKALR